MIKNALRLFPPMPPGMLAVPAVEWMWTRAVIPFVGLVNSLPYGSLYSFELGFATISAKRNHLVETFLADETLHWLWFLDSDMVAPPETLKRLLAQRADIVGGLFCCRQHPYPVVAGHVPTGMKPVDPLRPTEVDGFRSKALDLEDIDGSPVEVDVLGTGCTLIHRHVFEALEQPWFVANDGLHRARGSGQGSDWNFCLRAREKGFRVVCDTGLHVDHLGASAISPSFARQVQRELRAVDPEAGREVR